MSEPDGRGGAEEGAGPVRRVLREQLVEEMTYKDQELQRIEERIDLTKMLLQRLRLGILAQHYGVSAFTPPLDFSKDSVGEQASWEEFEQVFLGERCGTSSGGSLDAGQGSRGVSPTGAESQSAAASQGCSRESSVSDGGCGREEEEEVRVMEGEGCEAPKVGTTPRPSTPEATPAGISRFYSKKYVIVGNTSQYIDPTLRSGEDDSTHKWMVYVRGPSEEADISHFVKTVRFFLHPSYHPNDIVLVSKPPFHLTRLGWGEFPVRVQLEFVDRRNKPVDIIHNLVLDRTHTGLQTLGAETVVNLDIAVDRVCDVPRQVGRLNGLQTAGLCSSGKPGLAINELHTSCNDTEFQDTPNPSRPPSPELPEVMENPRKHPLIIQHVSLPPSSATDITLLDHDYCASVVVSRLTMTEPPDPGGEEEGEGGGSSADKALSTNSPADAVAEAKPLVLTTNLDKVLHRAVQATPLWGPPSEDFFLPALSLSHFKKWNVGRRRAAEWMRAAAVRKFIQRKLQLPALSTREVLEWCRRNGYTPLDPALPDGPGFCKYCGCQLAGVEGEEEEMEEARSSHEVCKELYEGREEEEEEEGNEEESAAESRSSEASGQHRVQFTTLSTPFELFETVLALHQGEEDARKEEDVDVEAISPVPSHNRPFLGVPRYRVPQTLELKWVQQTAARIGIRVYPAVIDRMYAHVVEHMLLMACSRFLKAILTQTVQETGRRVLTGERGGESSQERVIVPLHIYHALQNLELCDFLTNRYMGLPREDSSDDH